MKTKYLPEGYVICRIFDELNLNPFFILLHSSSLQVAEPSLEDLNLDKKESEVEVSPKDKSTKYFFCINGSNKSNDRLKVSLQRTNIFRKHMFEKGGEMIQQC